ncbi:pyridine nucleotide-disulfide oxidoreductase, class I [Caballeronia novacaledonica]|uniref:Pyridine nucleotide-disulfide oxidoreductase, class I n=1 Tax=Caballeronia novacaledonica TaxID=1544861 RepID=A0A2U3IEC0_9BURK|nr:FAD-dependent oxidoreductase [Caballeronia novacaledonica]SPB18579.1 pyridine nucleotide-disulfide oxidoreductase, class I [Caballeronia novacaledonica]
MSAASHVVIVGAGHAGGRVAQHLKALGHRGPLTLIGDEPHVPYERPALSKELLSGKTDVERIQLAPGTFWQHDALAMTGIERIHGCVVSLDADTKTLRLADDRAVPFDVLVVATGGAPRMPAFVDRSLRGVHALRTLDDCFALRTSLEACRRLAIVGAGVIGMEVASTAITLGVPVTVLEGAQGIMGRCLPATVAQWLAARHVEQGVDLRTGVSVTGIGRGDRFALRVLGQKDDARFAIDADCVLVAIGVDCEPGFLRGTGLSDARGVIVDEYCRSIAAPWLYAAGDAACTRDAASGLHARQETWRNAENQARAVAEFILGRDEPYRETPWMWTDQLGHTIQVTGTPGADDVTIVRGDLAQAEATILSLREGCVRAGVTVNQSRERRHLERLVSDAARIDMTRLADASVPLKELAR